MRPRTEQEPPADGKARFVEERLYTRDYATLFGVEFALFGVYYTLLPVIPLYIVELGGTEATVGLIMGLMAPVAALGTPIYGMAVDQWSRKRTAAIGFVIAAAGVLLLPVIAKPWLLIFPDLLRRVGTSATGAATRTALIDIAPIARRGEAISTITISHNLATAVGPLIGLALMQRSGIVPVVAVCAGLAVFGALGIVPIRGSRTPAELANPVDARRFDDRPRSPGVSARQKILLRTVTPQAWMPAVVLFLFVAAFFGTLAFVSLLGDRRGISGFGTFFTVYGVVVIGSRLVVGRLSDRYGRRTVLAPCLVLGIFSMILLGRADNLAMLLAAGIVLGIGWGSAFPTLLTLAADLSPVDRYGTTMAMMSAAFAFGTAVGAIVVGSIAEKWGFDVAYGLIAGLLILALVVLLGESRSMRKAGAGRVNASV
jgi:MFS family permease